MNAAQSIVEAALAALRGLALNGIYDGRPVQATSPYAVVEVGPEADWSHKSGPGRELRLAVTIHDQGETPARLRGLAAEAEAALAALAPSGGWNLVTLRHLRSRVATQPGPRFAAAIEFRARMLAE